MRDAMSDEEVAGFEARLREMLAFTHDCDCERCQEHQCDEATRTVTDWALLTPEQQADWLEDHGEHDELGAALRALLEQTAADGRDLVAFREEIEARWPRQR
jgi:hypothetical protein